MKKNNLKIFQVPFSLNIKKVLICIFLFLVLIVFLSTDLFSIKIDMKAKYSPFIFTINKPLVFYCFTIEPYDEKEYKYSLADIDLAIKFLLMEEKIPFNNLQEEYSKLLEDYNPVLNAQFNAFKYWFCKVLVRNKKVYDFDTKRLDDDNYIKERFKAIQYGSDGFMPARFFSYLLMKIENDGKINPNYNITFKDIGKATIHNELNYSIIYFLKMLLDIDRFNSFFNKYNQQLNELFLSLDLENCFLQYCKYFNINPKENILFLVDFIDEIYFLKEKPKNDKLSDIEKYKKTNLFAFNSMNSITFSYKSVTWKVLFYEMFFHELTHFFQNKSRWISEEQYSSLDDADNRYFTYKLPERLDNFAGWNSFLSNFHSSGKYIFCEFDAEFTCLEMTKNILESENYLNYDLPQILDCTEFIQQIYILFLDLYKEYAKENDIKQIFYVQNIDPDIKNENIMSFSNPNNDSAEIIKDNLYKFFYYKIYKERQKILNKIHRAVRYFGIYYNN